MAYRNLWTICAAASAAAVVGTSAPAAAAQQQDTTIVGKQAVKDGRRESVSYRDLDLAEARDARTFSFRVKRAARQVCLPNDDVRTSRQYSECVSIAWNGAQPQVDLAMRRAREIASLGTSTKPFVAIAVVGVR